MAPVKGPGSIVFFCVLDLFEPGPLPRAALRAVAAHPDDRPRSDLGVLVGARCRTDHPARTAHAGSPAANRNNHREEPSRNSIKTRQQN
jgi:hypothetical protein